MSWASVGYLTEFPEKNSPTLKTWIMRNPYQEDVMVIRTYPDRSCVTIFRKNKILIFERVFLNEKVTAGFLNFVIKSVGAYSVEKVMEYFSTVDPQEMETNKLMFNLEEAGNGDEYSR